MSSDSNQSPKMVYLLPRHVEFLTTLLSAEIEGNTQLNDVVLSVEILKKLQGRKLYTDGDLL